MSSPGKFAGSSDEAGTTSMPMPSRNAAMRTISGFANMRSRSYTRSFDANAHLLPVRADVRHVHRVADQRQRMERARNLGSQWVADLPRALREVIDEQRDIAIAQ